MSAVEAKLDAARQMRDAAGQQLTEHKLKANCEELGGKGCVAGRRPEFKAEQIRASRAEDDQRRAESDIAGLEAQLAAAERKRDAALAAFHARENEFLEAAKAIDARAGAELVPARNDALMSYMALQKVFNSPVIGPAAHFYAHMPLALLLVMELSYVLVSEYFGHASIYMARLIARTKILATEAADHYRQATGAPSQQDGAPEQTVFRPVPRFGSNE